MIQLAYYITLQGYKPEQLTIVTLYVGQVLMIRKVAMKYNFNVRITSVDNYQGEENDFIILSLVRSNAKFDIGFWKRSIESALPSQERKLVFMFSEILIALSKGRRERMRNTVTMIAMRRVTK